MYLVEENKDRKKGQRQNISSQTQVGRPNSAITGEDVFIWNSLGRISTAHPAICRFNGSQAPANHQSVQWKWFAAIVPYRASNGRQR